MDFYIDGGGGGSTGGLPTGWDPGSPGVTGGGGGAPPITGMAGGSMPMGSSFTALVQSPYLSPSVASSLQSAYNQANRWFGVTINGGTAAEKESQAAFNAYRNAVASARSDITNNSNQFNQVLGMPRTLSALGIQTAPAPTMPASEVGLLGEYGIKSGEYNGPVYSDFTTVPTVGALSAYNTWKGSIDKNKIDSAIEEYNNSQPVEFPKPWTPPGAPSFIAGDNPNPEDIDLKPYNPLKSYWKGKVDLSGLAKGLMGLLMGSGGSTNNM